MRVIVTIVLVVVAVVSIVYGVLSLPGFFWHPIDTGTGSTCSATNHTGCGYASWSGYLGSFLTSIPGWAIAIYLFLRHANCHQPWCLRTGRLSHSESGTRWCYKHAPADLKAKHPNRHLHWTEFKHPPHHD